MNYRTTDYQKGDLLRLTEDENKGSRDSKGYLCIKAGTVVEIVKYHWGGFYWAKFRDGEGAFPERILAPVSPLVQLAKCAE